MSAIDLELRNALTALRNEQLTLHKLKETLETRYQLLISRKEQQGGQLNSEDSELLQTVLEDAKKLAGLESQCQERESQLLATYGAESVLRAAQDISELSTQLPDSIANLNQIHAQSHNAHGNPLECPDDGLVRILCCQCGVSTIPNETRMCLKCLESEANILMGMSDSNSVVFCKSCDRYETPTGWLRCQWESKELLALCLKRIKKPKDARIVSAVFVWTESHSRRIKVKVGIEKDAYGATLRQHLIVTFVIATRQCPDCTKSVTPHVWVANVQIRQRSEHKRTLLFLEQLILRNGAHSQAIKIVDRSDGLDFFFGKPQHAAAFVQFVRQNLCTKVNAVSTQLISHDFRNNFSRNKFVQMVELCEVCRDDLIFLPKKLSILYGGISQIMLCRKISTGVHLLDPHTLRGIDIDGEKYWKNPFFAFLTRSNLVEFVVLNVDVLSLQDMKTAGCPGRFLTGMMESQDDKSTVKKAWGPNSSCVLADVEVARASDLGRNDRTIITRSHLGHILRPGDTVLGYDLVNTNINDRHPELIPFLRDNMKNEAVLVKKAPVKKQDRSWVLKQLPKDQDTPEKPGKRFLEHRLRDVEAFKEEVDEDPELRCAINLYRNPHHQQSSTAPDTVNLADLLDGLTIHDDVL